MIISRNPLDDSDVVRGEGESGYGPREQGRAADALFTVERTVTMRPSGRTT